MRNVTRFFNVGLALAALMLPGAALAATDGEEDRMVINKISTTDFEVVQGVGYSASVFWCGAATFIERRQGLPGGTEIYLKRGVGPSMTTPQRRSVLFSTSSAGLPAATSGGFSLTVEAPGEMMKAVNARSHCRDAFTRSTK